MGSNLSDDQMTARTVPALDPRLTRTSQLSPRLRWLKTKDDLVLQQALVCLEDGSIDWIDVPVIDETKV